jgi:hypothetical protein
MCIVASSAEFIRATIGKPYAWAAQGPDAFDCWGLTRACQREVFGRELPIVGSDATDLRALVRVIETSELRSVWIERAKGEAPAAGDIVTMTHAHRPHHVGVWLDVDGGGALHALEDWGVCFDNRARLRMAGFGRLTFHRFGGAEA